MNLAGNPCMYMSMQRWNASLMKINEFSPAGYPAGTLFVCRRALSAGEQTEEPTPHQLPFIKGHCDHLDRSNVRVKGWEHLSFKREARLSNAQVIAYRTLMDKR